MLYLPGPVSIQDQDRELQFSPVFFKGPVEHGKYSVAHSPQVFVVDPAGRLRAELYGASNEAVAGITRALLEEAGRAAGVGTR